MFFSPHTRGCSCKQTLLLIVPRRLGLSRHTSPGPVVDPHFLFLAPPPPLLAAQESMDALHRRLERSRQMQTVLKAFEARDRNLLEDNLWRVSFWSCASVLVMLCVALTQVRGGGGAALSEDLRVLPRWFWPAVQKRQSSNFFSSHAKRFCDPPAGLHRAQAV